MAALVGAVLLGAAGLAVAQETATVDPKLAEGMRYVEGLQLLRLPDIAELVIRELQTQFPDAGARIEVLKEKAALAQGKFDEVKARIGARPDADSPATWGMKLALADSYYSFAKYAEAKGIYEAFFKRFENPPPELISFFSESAYKYAQMLLYLKETGPALDAYRRLLKVKLPQHFERQCLAEMAEIAVKVAIEAAKPDVRAAHLKDADGWADKLLWAQDIWFGKAIVTKAHIQMLQGKSEAAKKLVEDYMPTLQLIHNSLVAQEKETGEPLSRISPMAECRYLLAVMLQEEAAKLMKQPGYNREEVLALLLGTRGADGKRAGNGAYNHFLNVFIKYPESTWAAEAGERAEQVRNILVNEFGGEIKTSVTPEMMAAVRKIQFQDARLLFNQGQFANATPRYRALLNRFPDATEAVGALGELARCFIQTIADDAVNELYADTVTGHLAERFCRNRETSALAGDELVRLAEYWASEANREEKKRAVYDLFFANYPMHPMAANYLAAFGERHYKDKDYPAALSYFKQVAMVHTNSALSYDALSRLATIYGEMNDLTNEVATLDLYAERLAAAPKPGQALMSAKYRQAQAYKDTGIALLRGSTNASDHVAGNAWLGRAASSYNKLAETLKQPNHPYQANEEDKRQNASLLEAALYNTAYCLSQVTQPAERIPAIRQKAVESYEDLVKTFPKSQFAPAALIQIGSIWTILKETDKAENALSRLLKDYPDTKEARSALPMTALNLLALGMREEALRIYRQMFAEAGTKYSDSDILVAAQELAKAKEYDLAQQGFERVLAKAKDVGLVAPAKLGLAQVMISRRQPAEAVKQLQAFIKEYPTITLVIDANLLLSQAASEAGMAERDDEKRKELFNAAVEAMKEVGRRRTTPAEQAQVSVEVGRIMARKAKAEEQFGKPDKAADSRGKALVSYQLLIMNTDPANLALAPALETAYAECIPLLLEHKKWKNAQEDCEAYLRDFPRGKYVTDVRTWLNQAQIELGTTGGGAPKPAAAPAAAPAGTNAPPAAPAG